MDSKVIGGERIVALNRHVLRSIDLWAGDRCVRAIEETEHARTLGAGGGVVGRAAEPHCEEASIGRAAGDARPDAHVAVGSNQQRAQADEQMRCRPEKRGACVSVESFHRWMDERHAGPSSAQAHANAQGSTLRASCAVLEKTELPAVRAVRNLRTVAGAHLMSS